MYDSSLVQCSSALQFYVFRAVEKVGLYNRMFPALLDPWRRMLADDLTTWAEFEHNPRSDCHGWSACPINEIVTQVFGVKPASYGSKRLRIEPQVELLKKAEGKFITPVGEIKLKWEENGKLEVEISSDAEAEVVFCGSVYFVQFVGGRPLKFVKANSEIL
jgi:hypothetical protein